MYHLRYPLLCVIFLLFGLNNASSQVYDVDYLIEYNVDSCHFDAKIVIHEGNAISLMDRSQFNSTYTFVIPAGSTLTITGSYEPKILAFPNPVIPTEWAISNSLDGPAITPDLKYVSVIPEIDPLSVYGNLLEGDTVTIFGFTVDNLDMCGEEVRLFENGVDPEPIDLNFQDYSNGFTMGSPNQIYHQNLEQINPPKPEVDFSIDCSGDVTIIALPDSSKICVDQLPYSYTWDGPGGFFSTDTNPIVPTGTGSGIYCATIVDNFGCDTIICEFLDVSVPEMITETLCGTDDYNLIFTAGGIGNWVFDPSSNTTGATIGSSSNGTATVTFTVLATGLYSFVFENSGCGGTAEITIMPSSSEPNVITDGPKCPGEITTLTADPISGATYNWNSEGAQGINTYQVGGPGMVSLEVIVGDVRLLL